MYSFLVGRYVDLVDQNGLSGLGVVKIRSRTQNNDDFALDAAIGPSKPDALVSCVGVVGTDADELRSGN